MWTVCWLDLEVMLASSLVSQRRGRLTLFDVFVRSVVLAVHTLPPIVFCLSIQNTTSTTSNKLATDFTDTTKIASILDVFVRQKNVSFS